MSDNDDWRDKPLFSYREWNRDTDSALHIGILMGLVIGLCFGIGITNWWRGLP